MVVVVVNEEISAREVRRTAKARKISGKKAMIDESERELLLIRS